MNHSGDRLWSATRAMEWATRVGIARSHRWEVGIALAELVSNAVKYGGGGDVEIVLRDAPNPSFVMTVRDGGTGFDPLAWGVSAELRHDPMRLCANATARGLGIGLDSVHRLMDAVEIESEPGAGTKITAIKLIRGYDPTRLLKL